MCQPVSLVEPRVILSALSLIILALPSPVRAQSAADCLACHSDASMTMERGGKQVSIAVKEDVLKTSAHKKLACTACHNGFDPANVPHKAKIEPIVCSSCHKDAGAKHPFHPQIARALKAGKQPDISCKDCHGTHDAGPVRAPGSKFVGAKTLDSCGACHPDVVTQFSQCSHGKALAAGQKGAPDCVACHKNPIAGEDKLARKQAQEKLCLACHRDNPDVTDKTAPTAAFIASYEKSVHGAALLKGNAAAANCVDCHGSHVMQKGSDPDAKSNKLHIRETCAKCHEKIAQEYSTSVHGAALAGGNLDAPVCTDCHGEHNIFKHNDPRSRVAAQNLSSQTCNPCHSSMSLSSKYGLASDRFKTFTDSYHGLAIKGGSLAVANCASCHGSHGIRRSSDPASMINKANMAATCGKCHPGANERFTIGAVHASETSKAEQPILYWLASGYVLLIALVIGGMFVHNVLDFIKKSKHKLKLRSGQIQEEHVGHAVYLRMTLSERLQHAALVTSFITLVVTGFMLRFPDAWWVRGIRLLSDRAFDLRSLIHRAAAVVMVLVSFYHVYYCAFTERGRGLVRDLFPDLKTFKDIKDPVANMKYYLGLSKVKPKFGRFSYIEKSEYWALVWGTFIMAATGFVMWFDNTFIALVTKLGYDIARTIHYYEAWLATLAIIVWHLYFVIFNPDSYPINLAFWKGTLTEAEMLEEHPLELEEIKRRKAAGEK